MKEFDEIQKSLEEAECDLMSREKALGKEDHKELLFLEAKHSKKKKEPKSLICIYCGEESIDEMFKMNHKCEKPQVVDSKLRCLPSRPIKNLFFKVVYNGKNYRFENYNSAMKFRNLVWIQKKSIKEAMKEPTLLWWVEVKK